MATKKKTLKDMAVKVWNSPIPDPFKNAPRGSEGYVLGVGALAKASNKVDVVGSKLATNIRNDLTKADNALKSAAKSATSSMRSKIMTLQNKIRSLK